MLSNSAEKVGLSIIACLGEKWGEARDEIRDDDTNKILNFEFEAAHSSPVLILNFCSPLPPPCKGDMRGEQNRRRGEIKRNTNFNQSNSKIFAFTGNLSTQFKFEEEGLQKKERVLSRRKKGVKMCKCEFPRNGNKENFFPFPSIRREDVLEIERVNQQECKPEMKGRISENGEHSRL